MNSQDNRPVVPETIPTVTFRKSGEKILRRLTFSSVVMMQAFVDLRCRPLMQSKDCGKTWIQIETPPVDYFWCSHPERKGIEEVVFFLK